MTPSVAPTSGRWSVLGVTWATGAAHWRHRPDGRTASTTVPIVGTALSYRALPTRVCLGHNEFTEHGRRYVDCGNDPGSAPRCDRCTAVENVAAASMHQAHKLGRAYVDRRQTEHLDQPHRLYLAAFRDGSVKVGTSAGASGGVRLVEQGAWVARYVGVHADGYRVRDAEDAVTEQLGVAQAVSTQRKLRGLVAPRDDAELEQRLDELAEQVRRVVTTVDADVHIVEDGAWKNPSADDERWQHVLAHPSRLDQGAHQLDVVDVVGRVGLVRRGADHLAVDLSQLRGVVIEFGDVDPDPIEVQASLF